MYGVDAIRNMWIKPDLKDEEIIACLGDAYELGVASISFLPLCADFHTVVYHVKKRNGEDYFLKLRSREFWEAWVSVPKYLADLSIKKFIPALATKTAQQWANLGAFKVILYPYIKGRKDGEAKPSEDQGGSI